MNKLKIALSLVGALLFTLHAGAQTVDDVNAKFNEAGQLIQAKKFAEAIPLLTEAITLGGKVGPDALPTVEQAQKYLPICYLRQGAAQASAKDYAAAVESFTKAKELGELYGDVRNSRMAGQMIAQVYLAMGGEAYNSEDYAKAAEVFAKGYAAAPNNTQLALYLAESYDKLDSLNKAVEVYKGIMALKDTHSRYAEAAAKAQEELTNTLLARAVKAGSENNLEEVVKYTGDILEYDPTNADATLLRVQVANNDKNYKAVTEYGQAAAEAQTDPVKKADAYFLLGAAYQNLDNKAKAIEAYRQVTTGNNVAAAKKAIADLSK